MTPYVFRDYIIKDANMVDVLTSILELTLALILS
jgi:hypothetical protein